ncbi:hypothetical protein, partial [Bacillus toyonensis]
PPPPPPPPPLPTGQQRIDVILELIEGHMEARYIKITGLGFQANEPIKIYVTLYANNEKGKIETLTTQSDITGSFLIQQKVQCSLDESSLFEVKSFGRISGNSNRVIVSC